MSDSTPSPAEAGNVETETVTVESLKEQIALLTAECDRLRDSVNEPSVEPIPFPDFEKFIEEEEKQGTSRLDLQATVFTHFVVPLKRRGFTVELNTSTAEGGSGRESSNGTSHKSQYLLSNPDALQHIDPAVKRWFSAQSACKVVFGETSYISADDAAASAANSTTGAKFKR